MKYILLILAVCLSHTCPAQLILDGVSSTFDTAPYNETTVAKYLDSGLTFDQWRSRQRPNDVFWYVGTWCFYYENDVIPTFEFALSSGTKVVQFASAEMIQAQTLQSQLVAPAMLPTTVSPYQQNAYATPEPATYGLIGGSVLLLLVILRRIKAV